MGLATCETTLRTATLHHRPARAGTKVLAAATAKTAAGPPVNIEEEERQNKVSV